MTAAGAATSHCKKAMKFGLSVFRRGFNSSKCKTAAKMAVARIKLLRNKRDAVVKQMRRDIAMLLQSGQDATARIRVEHVIREQNIMAANEFLELFCELVVSRLSIITKQRNCPEDLKEGIASLIFAAPRCADIPELTQIRDIFEKKYGKDFVSAATDLRPDSGVNRMLIDKLSVRTPSGQVKLKVMKEIAKEHQIDWDTTESEMELLKPPEELIEGPRKFVSATSMPLKPVAKQPTEPSARLAELNARYSGTDTESNDTNYQDTASAAAEAAECAKKAIAAAEAAAILARRDANQMPPLATNVNCNSKKYEEELPRINRRHTFNNVRSARSGIKFDESDYDEEEEFDLDEDSRRWRDLETRKVNRRHSYNNVGGANSNPKFDESEESDMEEEANPPPPPSRPAPGVPKQRDSGGSGGGGIRVHPKLPDYEALAARFESLKHHPKA